MQIMVKKMIQLKMSVTDGVESSAFSQAATDDEPAVDSIGHFILLLEQEVRQESADKLLLGNLSSGDMANLMDDEYEGGNFEENASPGAASSKKLLDDSVMD